MKGFGEQRRTDLEPVVERLHAWLEKKALLVTQSMPIGKTVNYDLGQWPNFLHYLDHPHLTPDANPAE